MVSELVIDKDPPEPLLQDRIKYSEDYGIQDQRVLAFWKWLIYFAKPVYVFVSDQEEDAN